MSYNDLLPWRALAQQIPKHVLNPTQRLVIITLMTYESDAKGAFFAPENIASELGLSVRAVLDNFHYLGSGLVWKKGKLEPCLNPECKDHLKIIKTTYYAKRGVAQTYRLDQQAIRNLVSVHSGAPIKDSVHVVAEKRAPKDEIACAPVHPHKRNKHLINVRIDAVRFYEVILKGVPKERRDEVTSGANYEALLDELEALDLSRQAIRDHLNITSWNVAKSVGAVVEIRLRDLVAQRTQVLALRAQEADTERQRRLEDDKRQREAIPPDQALNYANEAREAMKRNKT